jgi:hypothetical protein
MAQAQAGLGNLEKAQFALNKAKGLDPELKFASSSNIESLQQAITPQVEKIEVVHESHTARNVAIVLLVIGAGVLVFFLIRRYQEQEAVEEAARQAKHEQWQKEMDESHARHEALVAERIRAQAEADAKDAALRAHKNYGKPGFDPENPNKLKTKKQLEAEAQAAAIREANARAERAEADARNARNASYSAPHTTVVNNSSNDLVTGMMIGEMMSGGHNNTTVIERDVYVAPPAPSYSPPPSRDSSWDNDSSSSSSKSSSWDSDDSSSKKSSSWDSDSSSSSSSDSSSSWSSSDSSSSSDW